MAISAYTVYKALKELANKDQRGFVTPQTFNHFAQPAQVMVFNDMFERIRRKRRVRQGQIDGGFNLASTNLSREDLSVFARDLPIAFTSSGVLPKPNNFAYIISVEKTDGTPIDIVYDESKFQFLRRSSLGAPTNSNPAMLVSNSFQLFPATAQTVLLRYYKVPQGIDVATGLQTSNTPIYAYTTINNIETYDPLNTIDFELPEILMPYLLIELGRMIGLNLRDRDVLAYSQIAKKDNDLMTSEVQG